MPIKPIKTEPDYDYDYDFALAEANEVKHHVIDPPAPVEAIPYRMEQTGLNRKDLEPYIGHSGRVSEVLNHKRPLSLDMIRKLWQGLHIPLESLIDKNNHTST